MTQTTMKIICPKRREDVFMRLNASLSKSSSVEVTTNADAFDSFLISFEVYLSPYIICLKQKWDRADS